MSLRKQSENTLRVAKTALAPLTGKVTPTFVILAAGFIVLAALILSSSYTVEQGDRAVVLRFGDMSSVSEPGFHVKIPFADTVIPISVRTRKLTANLPIYSKDIQSANVILSVNYALNPALVADIFSKYGRDYEERVINPQIQSRSKDAFGQYTAVETVQSRENLTHRILEDLRTHFQDTGINVESIQIENIDFSKEYEKSVEERMRAEVEVSKVRQNYEREKINADMVRTKAQGEADAKVMQAKADAESIRLLGEAEAAAIKAKTQALSDNPRYVELIQAEKWDGQLPGTMIPNTALPIIGK